MFKKTSIYESDGVMGKDLIPQCQVEELKFSHLQFKPLPWWFDLFS
jgi:hypothetical protein